MLGKTVAILETRAGEQLADLVRRQGGTPFRAPALAEVPDVNRDALRERLDAWRASPPHVFVFQTGVGARALFAATDTLAMTGDLLALLDRALVVVRGPKPTAALRARGVRIDLAAAEPFTTREVLAALDAAPSLPGRRVVVQRYGEHNRELHEALEQRGYEVGEIATYRWDLPPDTKPLRELVDRLEQGTIDAVAFTSGAQATNLFAVADADGRGDALRAAIGRTLVASIGPVCSSVLRELGVRVDVEASPPKLGPFMRALADALAVPDEDSPRRR